MHDLDVGSLVLLDKMAGDDNKLLRQILLGRGWKTGPICFLISRSESGSGAILEIMLRWARSREVVSTYISRLGAMLLCTLGIILGMFGEWGY